MRRRRRSSYCLPEFIDKDGNRLDTKPKKKSAAAREVCADMLLAQHSECDSLMLGGVLIKSLGQTCPVTFRTDMPHAADCVFYSDLAKASEQRMAVPEVLLQIRRHPFSMTKRNEENIQSWVLDEWEAIQHAFGLMDQAGLPRWLRRQKLRCMFAARSRVKMQQMTGEKPEYPRGFFKSPRAPRCLGCIGNSGQSLCFCATSFSARHSTGNSGSKRQSEFTVYLN
ncbi:MAG: hypothetical protein Ct9H300mP7_1570 [Verrucomicrobiota bacterium]|nr:MAG: hypothetical protein Ct9H300mP7_1570 [Verrucomicrobiota bacterium]